MAVKFITINLLIYTLPDEFVREDFRAAFSSIVKKCNKVQNGTIQQIPTKQPPNPGCGLIVSGYEHIERALSNREALDDLIRISLKNECWFFNTFYYPNRNKYNGDDLSDYEHLAHTKINYSEAIEVRVNYR